jgi:pimeloyl-CoA dehydrogenase small subunit
MDFDLSEEQQLLKASVERLLAAHYDFEARRTHMQEPDGFSRALWRRYAELGLLGLFFGEEHGGIGGSAVETMIVMEAFGRALVLEPYLSTAVLCGSLLRLAGSAAQRDRLLPAIASGEILLAFAHAEPQARYDLADVKTSARMEGSGYVLDGTKTLVLHGDSADELIVSAQAPQGLSLFLIEARGEGVTRRGYPTIDGQRAAAVSLARVRVPQDALIGEAGAALPLIERVADIAIAALGAEAVGAMAAMHELTVEYLKARKQFGVSIGEFQVLAHRAADMLIALEQARSMAMLAAMTAAEESAAERRKAISAAKVQICSSGRIVGQQAIQLHGGIGMTYEYKLGHYFKRVTVIESLFGDAAHHLNLLARYV